MKLFLSVLMIIVSLSSCSDKYLAFKNRYSHKSPDGNPDYKDLAYWASHPWKWDPADSIPKLLMNEPRDSVVDVFFLHPTMFVLKKKMKKWNADIDDHYINAKTDYSSMLYQASAFNQHARIFAPRYREAHIKAFFTKDTATVHFAGAAFFMGSVFMLSSALVAYFTIHKKQIVTE